MTINTLIQGEEAKSFIYWLLGELDEDGKGFDYWFKRFVKKEQYGKVYKYYGETRRCYGSYNVALKVCRELCGFRKGCEAKLFNIPVGKRHKRCSNCIRPAEEGKNKCKYHQERHSQNSKKSKDRWRKEGRCSSCGGFNDRLPDRLTCSECAERASKNNKKRYRKKHKYLDS